MIVGAFQRRKEAGGRWPDKTGGPGHDPGRHFPCPASLLLPLLAGIFQQCYNTVDSIVLGNFVGKAALAAVGTTTPIINTLIGLFLGLSAGIGVVISQFYGAKEEEKVGQAVQTSLLLVLLPELVLLVQELLQLVLLLELRLWMRLLQRLQSKQCH